MYSLMMSSNFYLNVTLHNQQYFFKRLGFIMDDEIGISEDLLLEYLSFIDLSSSGKAVVFVFLKHKQFCFHVTGGNMTL